MKLKDLNFIESDDTCGLCAIHDLADSKIDGLVCPKCSLPISLDDANMKVVGETSAADSEESIIKVPVISCRCGATIALIPIEIIWNANHDVYYTGGKRYIISKINFKHRLLPHIKQYHDRILAGENLRPYELEVWLQYEIEHIIAEYLYDNDLKK